MEEDTQNLIDALTSHISLYHSSNPNPNPNPRNPIIRWFSSLPLPTRQSTLTLTDPKFVRILLEMTSRVDSTGHGGSFFLLPDLPSSDDPSLPSLCFRRSRGLLARSVGPTILSRSLLLFGSIHEEDLDSVTVDEGLVGDVDLLVEVMDAVSGGGFLRGEADLEKEWAEMGWLKEKGYYSLEEFVANRLEVALRVAWRGCSRKGKGRRGKEETGGGMAAGALRRKKGWWIGGIGWIRGRGRIFVLDSWEKRQNLW